MMRRITWETVGGEDAPGAAGLKRRRGGGRHPRRMVGVAANMPGRVGGHNPNALYLGQLWLTCGPDLVILARLARGNNFER